MARQLFYATDVKTRVDTLIGERHIPDYSTLESGSHVSNSYVLFCPVCQEIWGRIKHEHPQSYCQPLSSKCPDHMVFASDGTFSANSRCIGDPRDPEGMPEEVLRRDLIALCTYFINNPKRAILLL